MPQRPFAALLLVLVLAACAFSQEWTRFRGPNGTGAIDGLELPDAWEPEGFNWKTKLPGIGHSSPVLWANRIFLLSADPDTATRYVLCIEASSGEILWQREFASETHNLHLRNSYATSTPAVDAEHAYVAWSTPRQLTFMAFTHQGELAWERDLGPFISNHGFGTSPMIFEDLVILCIFQRKPGSDSSGKQGGTIVALDRRSGETRWTSDRISKKEGYTVPCIYRFEGGDPQLITCSMDDGVISFDPRTGQQNWSLSDAFTFRTVSSPVIFRNLIFGSNGSGGGGNYVVAVRATEKPSIAYKVETQAPYVPTPVLHGNLLFLWSDKGIVTCVDAADGRRLWQKRVGGNFSASPIRVGEKVYCVSDDGELVCLAAKDEFEFLGRTMLGEASRSTPAVAGGKMFLRTYSHLISVGGS